MRYYEIVFMVHPDCTDRMSNIISHYTEIIVNASGKVHRVENWGRRQLAYPIKKLSKAYYVLLNIEVSKDIINVLDNDFRFNDVIIRSMIIRTKHVITKPSPMIQKKEENQEFLTA